MPEQELREAVAAEGQGRTMVKCGYNCLLVETPDGRAVIDTGLGARFPATARGRAAVGRPATGWPRRGLRS